MPNGTGLLQPLPLSGGGEGGMLISCDLWDLLATRVNNLNSPTVNPSANSGVFYVSKAGIILDLAGFDARLQAVENQLGSTGAGGVPASNSTIYTQINTVSVTVANIESRLNAASATANCVGNVVTITFTI